MSKDYAGGARSGADGNTRLLKEYGGSKGSDGMSKCYAHGGSVHGEKKEHKPHKAEGGEVEGMSAKGRLDRPGRKMKGKDDKKGKGTNVNVIIMSGKGDAPPPGMAGPVGGPPPAGPPMMPPKPPMAPPMAGGPPGMPPMHKDGGKVHGHYKHGGHVKKDHKANGGAAHIHADGQDDATEREAEDAVEGRRHGGKVQKKADGGPTTKYREMKNDKAGEYDRAGMSNGLTGMLTGNSDLMKRSLDNYNTADDIRGQGAAVEDLINRARGEDLGSKAARWAPRKNGGSVGKLIAAGQTSPAESEAEHAKKHGGKVGRADGGRVPHFDAGAGGGKGRLEKERAYGK